MSTEHHPWHEQVRPLTRLALPVVGLNLMTVLSLFVDNAMCGRLPNNEVVLSALGYGTSLVFLFLVAMMGLSVGTVAMVSRAVGSADTERANDVLSQSLLLTLIISGIVALLGIVFGKEILGLIGAEDETVAVAMRYLRPVLGGTVFYYLNILFGATLRGTGNTLTPFVFAVISNCLNIVINYSLIFGEFGMPQLGIEGAGIGTVVSQAIGACLFIGYLRFSQSRPVTVRAPKLNLHSALLRQITLVGLPAALDMVVFNIGILAIVKLLSGFGDPVVAAHSVGFRVSGIAFVPGLAIAQAAAALVGIALGASNIRLAKANLYAAVFLCLCVMTTLACFTTYFAPSIVAVFDISKNSPAFSPAVTWIRILGLSMPIFGIHVALNGLFQGAGATWMTLRINAIVTLTAQVPLSILGAQLGPAGVWAAFPLAFTVKMVILGVLFKRGAWAVTGKDAVK